MIAQESGATSKSLVGHRELRALYTETTAVPKPEDGAQSTQQSAYSIYSI